MKILLTIWATAMLVVLTLPSMVQAAIPAVYTNDNFWSSEHDQPVSFHQSSAGNFYGTTATGKTFSQTIVENSLLVRLHKFSIDEAFFYISDRGVIKADNDLVALSMYLAKDA